ncbi:hypothetical protein ACQEVB_33910 [Pseudonocardia sp. CA-107938]|uniref:hypothetical protein n=1 Tax=Pseudonocardia sp. CA-107938 TaxID=3240021 RepID=UPI003D8EF48C
MGSYEGDAAGMVDAAVAKAHADAAGLRVDAENVLYVRKAILEEYEELKATLDQEGQDLGYKSHLYGGDPVSADAAIAFPERVSRLIGECHQHVNELLDMATKLEAAAKAYHYTDDEIAAMTPQAQVASVAAINATLGTFLRPWERT